MSFFHYIMKLLFPPRCVLCGKLLKRQETDLCHHCRIEAPCYPDTKRRLQFLDSFAAVWYYESSVRRSLLRFKFHGARHYAVAYGRLLAMKLTQLYPEGFDVVTWIPVSRLRRFSRGYDQVELLARSLGRELGMEPESLLRKIRHNRRQASFRDSAHRRANVLGVYEACCPERIRGKRILLLDDILTTGSTAQEAGRVLLTAGAKEVHCAVLASAQKR